MLPSPPEHGDPMIDLLSSETYVGGLLDDGLEDDGCGAVRALVSGDLEGVDLDAPLN